MSNGEIALIGAGALIVAGAIPSLLSFLNGKKLDTIHVLVNSNLTHIKDQLATAVAKIERLERERDEREPQ
jgi:hypothetical protein